MKRILSSIRRVTSTRVGTFVQATVYLLLTAGLVAVMMAVAACDCNDNGIDDCDYEREKEYQAKLISLNRQSSPDLAPDFAANIKKASGGMKAGPEQRVSHLLGGKVTGGTPPAQVDYEWLPPEGATGFLFPARQPEPGGPPFIFVDVPPDEQIPVEYDLPGSGVYGGDRLPETLIARPSGDMATTAVYVNTLQGAAVAPPALELERPDGSATWPAQPDGVVDMWLANYWFGRAITVSTEECQQAVDLLQSDSGFVALSLPEPPHAVTESALVPIYYNPQVELIDYAGGLDVAGEAEIRPERLAFAANALPAAEGRMWATLAVPASPAITCPAVEETGDWELYVNLTLDLSFAPDNCEGCRLQAYICYEGQALPGGGLRRLIARQQINRALKQMADSTTGVGVESYQGWGITCAGPLPIILHNDPTWLEWYLAGTSAQWVSPTMPITLPFMLEQDVPNPPQLIDLEYHSELDIDWSWSDGTQPIVPPISYAGGWPPQPVYLVGTVPPGTAGGIYMTHVTATLVSSPADYRIASAVVWVGDWLSPPIGGGGYRVYLPLLFKRN